MIIRTRYMKNYPRNGKHIELELGEGLPCTIRRGEDPYEYKSDTGEVKLTNKHLWYVDFKDMSDLIPVKGFKTPENAVQHAAASFTKLLVKAIKELDVFDNVTIQKLER